MLSHPMLAILPILRACQDLESQKLSIAFTPRASLTNVVALNGVLGGPEAETDVLHPSPATLSSSLGLAALLLGVLEDVRLLLESALALDGQLGRHDCCAGQSFEAGDDVCIFVGGRRGGASVRGRLRGGRCWLNAPSENSKRSALGKNCWLRAYPSPALKPPGTPKHQISVLG